MGKCKEKVRVIKQYAESFKKHVVLEIESGILNQAEASKKYNIPRQTISGWVDKYGVIKKQFVEVIMKDQKAEIKALKEKLADMCIKLGVYECMMEEAGKDYGFTLKKNINSKELELIKKETGEVLKKYVL